MLSIIIPVYNERETLAKVLVAAGAALPSVDKEIIVVDDGSTDGTREWLKANFPAGRRSAAAVAVDAGGNLSFVEHNAGTRIAVNPIYHERNSGKGASVRTGFKAATGEVFVIQDADLEYDPAEWGEMHDLIVGRAVADVVYGSRFYGRPHRSLYLSLSGQPANLSLLQSSLQPDSDRHRDRPEDDVRGRRKVAAADCK
ncbi:hypothetical protein BH10PSE9_BH10PSE9_09790 [soil metagenome]